MPDVCDIGQIFECIKKGHDRLNVTGAENEATGETVTHGESGISFAYTFFCKRCGLVYWEPKPTATRIDFTTDDGGWETES